MLNGISRRRVKRKCGRGKGVHQKVFAVVEVENKRHARVTRYGNVRWRGFPSANRNRTTHELRKDGRLIVELKTINVRTGSPPADTTIRKSINDISLARSSIFQAFHQAGYIVHCSRGITPPPRFCRSRCAPTTPSVLYAPVNSRRMNVRLRLFSFCSNAGLDWVLRLVVSLRVW